MRGYGLILAALVCAAACSDGGTPPVSGEYDVPIIPSPKCTADTRTDRANCGRCGTVCATDQRCAEGGCVPLMPLDDYASCRADGLADANCDRGRRCLTVGSGGPRICGAPCLVSGSVCPGAPAGSDARPTCVAQVFYCALACDASTQCPNGQTCHLLPPSMASGYCTS